jgi:hypothetical protein
LDAKNTNAEATSSGWPSGVLAPYSATLSAGFDDGCSGVQIGPGDTPLTGVPHG